MRSDEELERELAIHLEQLVKQFRAEGLSEAEARLAAQREFGSPAFTAERCRDARGGSWLRDFGKDLAYAVRMLRKSPGFTMAAVLTLALGIGANTAVFSVIDAVLLRPLPFRDGDRLVLVSEYSPGNVAKTGSPLLRYQARAAQNTVFAESAAYWDVSGGDGLVFGAGGSAERLQFSVVTNSFFGILGVQPLMGRVFSAAEERPDGAKVFLASYGAWQRLMGSDPATIGKNFRLDGEPYTLVGVLPRNFQFPARCEIWTAVGSLGAWPLHDRASHQFWMLGRLRPGVSMARAQTEMDAIQHGFALDYPKTDANWRVNVRPLLEEFVGPVRTAMWVLFGAVGFVLLLACTNVVNLLLSRAAAREREFAVRVALGASRARLLRQSLTEALLLATGGISVGLLLAKVALRALVALSAGSIPRFEQPHLSALVLAFAVAAAIAVTLIVGLAPGLQVSDSALRSGPRGGFGNRRSTRLRSILVVAEVAITLVLLAGAGLMLRSFQQLRQTDPGFRADGLTTVRIALPDALYRTATQRAAFLRELLDRLNRTPGIAMAAAADRLPLSGEGNWGRINIAGRPILDSASAPSVEGRSVSGIYFGALGIPLLRGRTFSEDDVAAGRRVTVINQQMANQFWPGADPIGQHVMSAYDTATNASEVIGVVGDIKDFALDAQSPPEMFSPVAWWSTMNLVLRSRGDSASALAAVRTEVARLDREVPVYDASSMNALVSRSVARQRFELLLLAVFAGVALMLAAIGIYGLLAFTVSRRTHEIGLRIALGAHPRRVQALLLRQGMRLVATGLAIGLAASLLLTQSMRGLLYRVSPSDPWTLAAVSALLALIGTLACWIPARRAMTVDPIVALRCE